MANEVYTVDIPGAADILRVPIPGMDDEELRKQRIARMKSHRGPLPEALDWVPPLITALDDAQDLLYVGLVLAKPLLKRLPARFIPGLGWVLFANDVVNLTTLVLGLLSGGTAIKRSTLDALDILNSNRVRRINNVRNFLQRTNWLGFALQAGQVSQTLTGYGISLGALMSCISDSVWSLVRLAQDKEIQVRLPPEADIVSKASRVIMQLPAFSLFPYLISDDDHALVLSSRKLAHDILQVAGHDDIVDARSGELASLDVPVFAPTNPASLRALEAAGLGNITDMKNVWAAGNKTDKFLKYIQFTAQGNMDYQKYMRDVYSAPADQKKILQMMFDEAGLDFWDFQAKQPKSTDYIYEPWELAAAKAIEHEVFPNPATPPKLIYKWLVAGWKMMYQLHFRSHWGWWLREAAKITIPFYGVYAPKIPENLPPLGPMRARKPKHISRRYHKCLWEITFGEPTWDPDDPRLERCRQLVGLS